MKSAAIVKIITISHPLASLLKAVIGPLVLPGGFGVKVPQNRVIHLTRLIAVGNLGALGNSMNVEARAALMKAVANRVWEDRPNADRLFVGMILNARQAKDAPGKGVKRSVSNVFQMQTAQPIPTAVETIVKTAVLTATVEEIVFAKTTVVGHRPVLRRVAATCSSNVLAGGGRLTAKAGREGGTSRKPAFLPGSGSIHRIIRLTN